MVRAVISRCVIGQARTSISRDADTMADPWAPPEGPPMPAPSRAPLPLYRAMPPCAAPKAFRFFLAQPFGRYAHPSDGPCDRGAPPRRPPLGGHGFPRSHGPSEHQVNGQRLTFGRCLEDRRGSLNLPLPRICSWWSQRSSRRRWIEPKHHGQGCRRHSCVRGLGLSGRLQPHGRTWIEPLHGPTLGGHGFPRSHGPSEHQVSGGWLTFGKCLGAGRGGLTLPALRTRHGQSRGPTGQPWAKPGRGDHALARHHSPHERHDHRPAGVDHDELGRHDHQVGRQGRQPARHDHSPSPTHHAFGHGRRPLGRPDEGR
jgi:hypothetical protein